VWWTHHGRSDLKEAANYLEQHARRDEPTCRCNACAWRMTRVAEADALARRRAKDPRFATTAGGAKQPTAAAREQTRAPPVRS